MGRLGEHDDGLRDGQEEDAPKAALGQELRAKPYPIQAGLRTCE